LGEAASPAATSAGGGAVGTLEEERSSDDSDHSESSDEASTAAASARGTARQGRRPRSRRGTWVLRGAVAAFIAALVVAVALHVTARQPGQTATGSAPLTASQQEARTLDQAATEVSQGQLGPAADLYQSVLAKDPRQEVALAQLGWIEYRVGTTGANSSLLTDARAKLERAVTLAPGDYAARLYLGTLLLLQDHDPGGAVNQYRAFLADSPPASVLHQAAPELRQAYGQAGVALPPGVS
jgi:hypothetical protein